MIDMCYMCGLQGDINPSPEDGKTLLAEDADGDLVCLPCYLRNASVCQHCGEKDDLLPDETCLAEPWLCKECLALPYRIHRFSCYSSGCMTLEEFADEAYREVLVEQQEQEERCEP